MGEGRGKIRWQGRGSKDRRKKGGEGKDGRREGRRRRRVYDSEE